MTEFTRRCVTCGSFYTFSQSHQLKTCTECPPIPLKTGKKRARKCTECGVLTKEHRFGRCEQCLNPTPATKRNKRQVSPENKKKQAARSSLRQEIASGRMFRPTQCTMCKGGGKTQAHHSDYDDPLNVVFVCRPCHEVIHYYGPFYYMFM